MTIMAISGNVGVAPNKVPSRRLSFPQARIRGTTVVAIVEVDSRLFTYLFKVIKCSPRVTAEYTSP